MDLTLSGNVQWFGGWGLNFAGGKAQASTSSSAKLKNLILSTGEYSIEAWVTPGNVVQEDMRIVSYSASLTNRNFNLGQTMYDYDFFTRSSVSNANGAPALSTPSADEVLQATLQHVVATFNPVAGPQIYCERRAQGALDPEPGGTLGEWDTVFAFVLGNEVSGNRKWIGVIRLVAIFNRALDADSDQAELRCGRRREVLPDVRRLAPARTSSRAYVVIRSRAVRQLLLPVPQALLHQLGRQRANRWASTSRASGSA
jgi:hypothetical protein